MQRFASRVRKLPKEKSIIQMYRDCVMWFSIHLENITFYFIVFNGNQDIDDLSILIFLALFSSCKSYNSNLLEFLVYLL
jgi:hypothetical protein